VTSIEIYSCAVKKQQQIIGTKKDSEKTVPTPVFAGDLSLKSNLKSEVPVGIKVFGVLASVQTYMLQYSA
jgi:hypothetical protein